MRDATPAVSVIIPTYQRAHVLARAIDSVLAQTFTDFEIIIVDDGSDDGTRELVSSYTERMNKAGATLRLTYTYQCRRNVASARNLGVQLARAELIAFLDSDDTWEPQKLQKQVDYLRSSSAAFVHSARALFTMPGNGRSAILPYPQRLASNRRELLAGTANVAMTVMVRREALCQAGMFDETLATTQDLDLWLRIAHTHELGLIDEPLVNSYKLADSNMAANPSRTYRDRIRVMQRMAKTSHQDVISTNWHRLAARHALSHAMLLRCQGKYLSAAYWALRGAWEFGCCLASSQSGNRLTAPTLQQILEP